MPRIVTGTASFIIDISDTFEQKLAPSAAMHRSSTRTGSIKLRHWISGTNIYQGGRCGFSYGELFALLHPAGGSDLVSLVTNRAKPSRSAVVLPGRKKSL